MRVWKIDFEPCEDAFLTFGKVLSVTPALEIIPTGSRFFKDVAKGTRTVHPKINISFLTRGAICFIAQFIKHRDVLLLQQNGFRWHSSCSARSVKKKNTFEKFDSDFPFNKL